MLPACHVLLVRARVLWACPWRTRVLIMMGDLLAVADHSLPAYLTLSLHSAHLIPSDSCLRFQQPAH